ncbi:MAG: hypothetical protein H6617_10065 [Bdellovibrionaceae bacterium]|nr:hypothetical protein [Pseudobdellovibrionaceae bacterium]
MQDIQKSFAFKSLPHKVAAFLAARLWFVWFVSLYVGMLLSLFYNTPRYHHFVSYRDTFNTGLMQRWFAVNFALTLVLVLLWKPIQHLSRKLHTWVMEPDSRYARTVVTLAFCTMIFTFHTRAHFGFWWFSIGGWTYENYQPVFRPDTEPPPKVLVSNVPSFLYRGIRQEVLPYLDRSVPKKGYGSLLFLHYKNGVTLPYNMGLLEVPFYDFIFRSYKGDDFAGFRAQLLRYKLESYYKKGYGFLLPSRFAYPIHNHYVDLNYANYPDPKLLEKASQWTVEVKVPMEGSAYISSAELIEEIFF